MILHQANVGVPPMEELERMARRRHQAPKPERKGQWWTLRYRHDTLVNGKLVRVQKRVILGPSAIPEREIRKIADEHLRPLNQGLETVGGAVNFNTYIEKYFIPLVMPQYAETTRPATREFLITTCYRLSESCACATSR